MFTLTKELISRSFDQFEPKGFQLTFPSGYTLSVQMGPSNYCERRSFDPKPAKDACSWIISKDAEIAVTRKSELLHIGEHDDVIGWVTVEGVATIIAFLVNVKEGNYNSDAVICDYIKSLTNLHAKEE